jgi:hypothetical protein
MSEVVEREPETLVEAMLRTAANQVLIRTLFSVNPGNHGYFSSHIFMAEGPAEGKIERLIHIRAEDGTSQTPVRLSGLRVVPGNEAPLVLGEWIAEQTLRIENNNTPWFTAWLTKEQHEGVLLLETDYKQGPVTHRRIPAHHPGLQLYFGAISSSLSLLAAERHARVLSQDESVSADMMNRLAERFGRFVWVQQRKILESVMGSGIE